MKKPKLYITILIAVVAMALIAQVWFWPIVGNFVLSANVNVALALLLCSFLAKKYESTAAQIIVFVLFILVVFKIINLNINFDEGDLKETTVFAAIGSFTFNPVTCLLFVLYYLINRDTVRSLVRNIFTESDVEFTSKEEKEVIFYYDMFSKTDERELESLLNNFNEYPPSAQKALYRIQEERNSNNSITQ